MESLFGSTSMFISESRKENLLTDSGFEILNTDSHYLLCLFVDTLYPDKLCDKVDDVIKNISITKKDFERRKRVAISNYVSSFDNIVATNEIIISNVMNYDRYLDDVVKSIKGLSFDEFIEFVKSLDFSNKSVMVINPNEKSNN